MFTAIVLSKEIAVTLSLSKMYTNLSGLRLNSTPNHRFSVDATTLFIVCHLQLVHQYLANDFTDITSIRPDAARLLVLVRRLLSVKN